MKKGVIITNAYSELKSSLYQSERLKEEFSRLSVDVEIKRNNFFPAVIKGGKTVYNFDNTDFCVYLDKDKYVSEMLERGGVRLFNRHRAIEVCDDKMLTAITLADKGIDMPETISGLLCYDPEKPVDVNALERVADRLSFPIIVKKCHGSLGKEVYKADDMDELIVIAEKVKCEQHIFQQFVSSSFGRDIRVIVIGKKVVAAMERVSDGDFRSNISVGGSGKNISLPDCVADMCVKTADLLGLDYCGIDVLFGEDGRYLLCEVNSNAFFGGIEKVTGINVAALYARYIFDEIYGR